MLYLSLLSRLILYVLLALCACTGTTEETLKDDKFLWGVSTAAYQIEGGSDLGGRGPSMWDTFSHTPGKIANNDNGDVAADSYHNYLEDVSLIKEMGLTSYRFSISWSRILPQGKGHVNYEGIMYYNKLIDALRENDIEPLVTLYHWDLPEALDREYGGWLSPQIEQDFVNYANLCFQQFGDRVKRWATLNEPWTFTYMGYVVGSFAPGRCSDRSMCAEGNSTTEGYLAAHNALNAHAAAVQSYRSLFKQSQGGEIGIVLNHDWGAPFDPNCPQDVQAANRHNIFQNGWFGDPLTFGDYPDLMKEYAGVALPNFSAEQKRRLKGSYDFLALNHYTTKFYTDNRANMYSSIVGKVEEMTCEYSRPGANKRALFDSGGDSSNVGGWFADQHVMETKVDFTGNLPGPQGASPWLVAVPWGFRRVLEYTYNRYTVRDRETKEVTSPKIYVTEVGCDVPGESEKALPEVLHDPFRIDFYKGYLQAMLEAMQEGVDIRGFFAWSLVDNFEWADGYDFRFGLVYVDYTDPKRSRHRKESSYWYANFVAEQQQAAAAAVAVRGRDIDDKQEVGVGRIKGGRRHGRQIKGWREYLKGAISALGRVPTIGEL